MKVVRKLRVAVVSLSAVASVLVGPLSPAEAYSPGTATPYGPTYNGNRFPASWDYKCNFKGWRTGRLVQYQCNIYHRYWEMGKLDGGPKMQLLQRNKGSWTPGKTYRTTRVFHEPMVVGISGICVEAKAFNVDGGVRKLHCR